MFFLFKLFTPRSKTIHKKASSSVPTPCSVGSDNTPAIATAVPSHVDATPMHPELDLISVLQDARHSPDGVNMKCDMVPPINVITNPVTPTVKAVVSNTSPSVVEGSRGPLRLVNGSVSITTDEKCLTLASGRTSVSFSQDVTTSSEESTPKNLDTTMVDDGTANLLDDYVAVKRLGQGAFGAVYLVQDKSTFRLSAVKVVPKITTWGESALEMFVREQRVARTIPNHPFVLSMEASLHDSDNCYLLTAFYPGGDLNGELERCGRFSHRRTRFYVAQLLLAVEHLQKHKIIHRDIKPSNVLLDACGNAVLADFGLCKQFENKGYHGTTPYWYTHRDKHGFSSTPSLDSLDDEPPYTTTEVCGTLSYMAPEVMLHKPYSFDVDIWSLGVTAFELRCSRRPWGDDENGATDHDALYEGVTRGRPTFLPEDDIGSGMEAIINRMLVKNPLFRATVDELKYHPYFSGVNWKKMVNGKVKAPCIPGEYWPDAKAASTAVHILRGKAYPASEDPLPELNYCSPRLEEPAEEIARHGYRTSKLKSLVRFWSSSTRSRDPVQRSSLLDEVPRRKCTPRGQRLFDQKSFFRRTNKDSGKSRSPTPPLPRLNYS